VHRGADLARADWVQELVLDRRHQVGLKIVLTRTGIQSVCNGNGSYYTRFCSIHVTTCNGKAIFQAFKMHFPVTLLHCNGIQHFWGPESHRSVTSRRSNVILVHGTGVWHFWGPESHCPVTSRWSNVILVHGNRVWHFWGPESHCPVTSRWSNVILLHGNGIAHFWGLGSHCPVTSL